MTRGYFKNRKFKYMKKGLRAPKFYTEHYCLDSRQKYPELNQFYQFAVVDPGTTSCGIRIVRLDLVTKIKTLVWFGIIDFGQSSAEVFENMNRRLAPIKKYLEDCHHIVTEHQLLKCEETYQGYASFLYNLSNMICQNGMRPMIVEIDVQLKTSYIGGPRNKQSNGGVAIKEWSKEKALNICVETLDYISYHILINSLYKAREDLSDTVCYEYAWISYLIETTSIFLPFDRLLFQSHTTTII